MNENWLEKLNRNPLPALLEWDDEALRFFVRRDLMGENSSAVETRWAQPESVDLTNKQLGNGSWKYPGKTYDPESGTNYFLLETYRNLRVLVEMYGFHRGHQVIQNAAKYLFNCQTKEGDIRGILGNQYMPYYHGAIEEIAEGLAWFLTNQEEDGLWPTGYGSGKKSEPNRRWVGLAICRMLKLYLS